MGDELSREQAQNGVNFDFEVKFDLEGQGQSPPKTIGILTKVFYTYGPNLVILAWTGDELSRGQTWWRTDGLTDGRTQATTIPEGQYWPRVTKHSKTRTYFLGCTVNHGRDLKCHKSVDLMQGYNITGDPLHSRALAHSRAPLFTQPCPHCSHSRAPGEQWARLCVFTLQGCVQAARLCRGSPVNIYSALARRYRSLALSHTNDPVRIS